MLDKASHMGTLQAQGLIQPTHPNVQDALMVAHKIKAAEQKHTLRL